MAIIAVWRLINCILNWRTSESPIIWQLRLFYELQNSVSASLKNTIVENASKKSHFNFHAKNTWYINLAHIWILAPKLANETFLSHLQTLWIPMFQYQTRIDRLKKKVKIGQLLPNYVHSHKKWPPNLQLQ